MKLQDGMLLFHGSYVPVENIDLSKCFGGKDFGRGFYLTSDRWQARTFISSSLRKAQRNNNALKNQRKIRNSATFRLSATTATNLQFTNLKLQTENGCGSLPLIAVMV